MVLHEYLMVKAQQEAENKRATNIINGIQDTAAAIADFDGDMNIKVTETPVLDEAGNQVMNSDGTPKVNRTITDPCFKFACWYYG